MLVAFAVGRFRPGNRKRLRRLVGPFLLHVIALGVALAMAAVDRRGAWVSVPLHVAWLLKMVLLINAGAIVLFDLVLPALRIRMPSVLHELGVGAAYTVTLIAFLRSQGVDLSSLVATSAVVTGILAFSMQATLGNVFGGIALQLDDSIHVGDWVRLDQGVEGQIREIGWRHTVIETRNWDTVIVPNAGLLGQNITILGKRTDRPLQHRMWVHFNVDFRFAPAEVIEVVEAGLRGAPIAGVAEEPAPNCVCLDFARDGGESFARYAIRYWLKDLAADDPTSSAVRVRLFAALRRAQIPLALPATAIFVDRADSEHARLKAEREQRRRESALKSVALFAPLTDDERARVAERLRPAPFAAGEVITRQGAEAHWLYLLCRGRAQVRIERDGRERVVNELEAPSFFGEHGLMTGAPRSATVVALTETDCYRLDKAGLQEVLQGRPELARDLSRILAERQQALLAVRKALDADAHATVPAADSAAILKGIQRFFGLAEDV